jgi:DNA helicase-2/ATP-dependent DNA helicase PcrA
MIARSIARRHPIVVCDEPQDSSGDQHAVVAAVLAQGGRVRIFGDPLQKIFKEEEVEDSFGPCDWENLKGSADSFEELDHPHRWETGCRDLGQWVLRARMALKSGAPIDLRPAARPTSVQVAFAEDTAEAHDQYRLSDDDREPIDRFVRRHGSLLILTRRNALARGIRAFFNREIPLWEGHTRDALHVLVQAVHENAGDPATLARAVIVFMGDIGVGFSPSAFGDALLREATEGCVAKRRGKPAQIQQLARCLVEDPTHRGVSNLLKQLAGLRREEAAFNGIKIDHNREYWEAVHLGHFESAEVGLSEMTHRRTYVPPRMPDRSISNIHKAKGLECRHAVVMPCSRATFPNTELARRLLYVAISRASHKLFIVASVRDPSPLVIL